DERLAAAVDPGDRGLYRHAVPRTAAAEPAPSAIRLAAAAAVAGGLRSGAQQRRRAAARARRRAPPARRGPAAAALALPPHRAAAAADGRCRAGAGGEAGTRAAA